MKIILYMIVMAGVTYLIRMLPFTLFSKKIKSVYLKSLLYYIPYAILSAMTIPGILYATGNIYTAIIGFAVAVITAFLKVPLIGVASASAAAAFIAGFFI